MGYLLNKGINAEATVTINAVAETANAHFAQIADFLAEAADSSAAFAERSAATVLRLAKPIGEFESASARRVAWRSSHCLMTSSSCELEKSPRASMLAMTFSPCHIWPNTSGPAARMAIWSTSNSVCNAIRFPLQRFKFLECVANGSPQNLAHGAHCISLRQQNTQSTFSMRYVSAPQMLAVPGCDRVTTDAFEYFFSIFNSTLDSRDSYGTLAVNWTKACNFFYSERGARGQCVYCLVNFRFGDISTCVINKKRNCTINGLRQFLQFVLHICCRNYRYGKKLFPSHTRISVCYPNSSTNRAHRPDCLHPGRSLCRGQTLFRVLKHDAKCDEHKGKGNNDKKGEIPACRLFFPINSHQVPLFGPAAMPDARLNCKLEILS